VNESRDGPPDLAPGFDFTDPDIYVHRLPIQELAELCATVPIWWNEQPIDRGGFSGPAEMRKTSRSRKSCPRKSRVGGLTGNDGKKPVIATILCWSELMTAAF